MGMRRTGCPPWSGVSAGSAEAPWVLPAKTGVDTFNFKHVLPWEKNTLNRGVGRPSKALLVGAKIVTGPGRLRMSMRSANWSRETKMEKSGLWTRRSRAEHSRSLQSRPADGGTCRIMST